VRGLLPELRGESRPKTGAEENESAEQVCQPTFVTTVADVYRDEIAGNSERWDQGDADYPNELSRLIWRRTYGESSGLRISA